jgi:hypothetical protein
MIGLGDQTSILILWQKSKNPKDFWVAFKHY